MNEVVLVDVWGYSPEGQRICRLRCIWNGVVILEGEPQGHEEEERLCAALAAATAEADARCAAALWLARDEGFNSLIPTSRSLSGSPAGSRKR